MTVETPGNLPAVPDEDFDGLEDFDDSDFRTPRLRIEHKLGQYFTNKLTNENIPVLEGVVLCMVRQRIKWAPDVEDDAVPQCKSPDFLLGYPTLTSRNEDDVFPWDESNFEPADLDTDEEGRHTLDCKACKFTEWDRQGKKNKPPKCNEMHTYAIRLLGTDETFVVSFSKTGVTPSTNYAASFKQQKTALFKKVTRISLKGESKAGNPYSVPVFSVVGPSDEEMWDTYAQQGRSIRAFLQMPPRAPESDGEPVAQAKSAAVANTPPPAAQAAPPAAPPVRERVTAAAPAAPAAPVADPVADDPDALPF